MTGNLLPLKWRPAESDVSVDGCIDLIRSTNYLKKIENKYKYIQHIVGPNLVKLSNSKHTSLRKSAWKFKDLTFLCLKPFNINDHFAM